MDKFLDEKISIQCFVGYRTFKRVARKTIGARHSVCQPLRTGVPPYSSSPRIYRTGHVYAMAAVRGNDCENNYAFRGMLPEPRVPAPTGNRVSREAALVPLSRQIFITKTRGAYYEI